MFFRRFSNLDQLLLFYTDAILKFAKLGIQISDNLSKNLITMHEWIYKHYRLEHMKHIDPTQDKRREYLVSYIESEINPLLFKISDDLENVYKDWLNKHDLENPDTWARSRLTEDDFEDYGKELSLENIKYEYTRLLTEEGQIENTKEGLRIGNEMFLQQFIKTNMDYFTPYFRELINETISIDQEDLNYYRDRGDEDEAERLEEEIKRLENIELTNKSQLEEFVDESIYNFGNSFLSEESIINNPSLYDMLVNFEREVTFPLWADKWVSSGIDETVADNKEIYNRMRDLEHFPFYEKLTVIEKALTGMHHTGPMLQYIERVDPGISKEFMDKLNNIGTTEETQALVEQWDKDLRDLGFWERDLYSEKEKKNEF